MVSGQLSFFVVFCGNDFAKLYTMVNFGLDTDYELRKCQGFWDIFDYSQLLISAFVSLSGFN